MKDSKNTSELVNWIEEAIVKGYFKYYEYKYFSNIQEIGSGRFGKVYRANWKNSEQYLALKSFYNLDNNIIHELELQRNMHFYNNIISFYGISKFESVNRNNQSKYLLVIEYADSGTLRNYLKKNFNKLTWNDKYNLAYQLACAVSYLHNEGIVHCNLNSSSVLVHQDNIKLADFGLSKRIEVSSNEPLKLFGINPYIDPKKFSERRCSFNKESDIYSVGVLLWEISSGYLPFKDEQYDIGLVFEISQGHREEPISNTPEDYIKVYTECWDGEPDNRPTINQVTERLKAKINTITENGQIGLNFHSQSLKEGFILNTSNNHLTHSTINQVVERLKTIITETNTIIINSEKQKFISSEMNLSIVNEIVTFIFKISNEGKGKDVYKHIFDYFDNYNINSQEVYNWLLNNQKDSDSILLLGLFNYLGIKTNKNKEKAFNLFINASEQNHIAQYYSGLCYQIGCGTTENEKLAIKYYEKAANLGNNNAQNNLAFMYENGRGIDKDYNKAFELYQKAANSGNSIAQYNLAIMYENGKGTNKDYNKAIELYQKAANLGSSDAQNNLANMYKNGKGVNKDYNKAIELYQKAANLGSSDAQNNLATMYKNGKGVDKDYSKAFELYQKAANSGNSSAQNNLANMYKNGKDIEKDYNKAFELYQKAANLGNSNAQYNLANMYEEGFGISEDINQAIYWYEQSAKQGDQDAQIRLKKIIK